MSWQNESMYRPFKDCGVQLQYKPHHMVPPSATDPLSLSLSLSLHPSRRCLRLKGAGAQLKLHEPLNSVSDLAGALQELQATLEELGYPNHSRERK